MNCIQRVLRVCLNPLLKIVVLSFPLIGMLSIWFIIFNDEFLSRHSIAAVILSFWFFATCCLLVLSKICVLRRKSAKYMAMGQLQDTDLEFDNEAEEVPYHELTYNCKGFFLNLVLKNPYEFCKFRPAYGMFLVTGFVSLLAHIFFLTQAKDWNARDDFHCVAAGLTILIILLIGIVYFVANSGVYVADAEDDSYDPFDQFVQIPMKVLVGKTVAIFITSGLTHAVLVLFMLFLTALCIISPNYIYHASEGMLKRILPTLMTNPRRFITVGMVLSALSCAQVLCEFILSCFIQVKLSILRIIEKNWQRNLRAIEFLLPNVEVETLQDLKDALDNKRHQQLTREERRAFEYITRPLWMTKQPFMGQRLAIAETAEQAEHPGPVYVQQQVVLHEQVQPEHDPVAGAINEELEHDPVAKAVDEEPKHDPAAGDVDEKPEQVAEQPLTSALRQRRQKEREPLNLDDTPAGAAKRHRAGASATPRTLRPRKQQ